MQHQFLRSLEAGIHNKANELQEDISLKRFDVRVAQLHLGAVNAQVTCYFSAQGTQITAHKMLSYS